ncbi:hypothetical protein AVEN_259230-1 [Araneus ventricosus]|uniref:Uncharacterized protein n=1 Tax=Araneus ventricosus TaxID=182803 RepID=A0A4Y2IHJ1_ARAVE|nr:hypothetical protein AVEN_259230-1 [Araneus ventricosus]
MRYNSKLELELKLKLPFFSSQPLAVVKTLDGNKMFSGGFSHVFLRVDAAKPSLHPPNTGPCTVLKRGEETFTLFVNGKEKNRLDRQTQTCSLSCRSIAISA